MGSGTQERRCVWACGERARYSSRKRERNCQAVRHADDDVADELPGGEMFFDVRRGGHERSDLGMGFEILLGAAYDLTFAAVGELGGSFVEQKPKGLADFDAHVF